MRIRRERRSTQDPKLASVANKLSDALEAIADDMQSGDYDATAVNKELEVATDIVNTLEDAGYEVTIDEDLKEAVGLEDVEEKSVRASRRPARRASRERSSLRSIRRDIRNLTR